MMCFLSLCCDCGVPIEPNEVNKCVGCVRANENISDSLPRQSQLQTCKLCQKVFCPPNSWAVAKLESKELLGICLKRLNGLKKVRLVDAKFIWTEPHSKRVKVLLKIQKEVAGVALLQSVVVEYVIHTTLCDECQRIEAKDYWRGCVQIRQKCLHKRSLFYLEQLVLKQNLYRNCNFINQTPDGMDFFYSGKHEAFSLVEYVNSKLPMRYKYSQELVSHDPHTNRYDYKHSYSVEIAPVCKDDIVCLPKQLASKLGSGSQLMICFRIGKVIHLVDPASAQVFEVSAPMYWRYPFRTIAQRGELEEYTVLTVETEKSSYQFESYADFITRPDKQRFMVGDVLVTPTSQLGKLNGKQVYCKTHLCRLLTAGDTVLGLDLTTRNVNNEDFDRIAKEKVPEVILVQKSYDRSIRRSQRIWKLKRLQQVEIESRATNNDYDEFLEDLEEDPTLRQDVNIYRDPSVQQPQPLPDASEMPCIPLHEILTDMSIQDEEMPQV
ncbi:60S ribosomal export protein NMD3 [Trichuris trichiura]|uniref:60S ribosomal export protein NMD3 n=1 Tax=Trichuris trichiura TaxID=36087 RepID=A0A077ZD29_TRITR|nr:60S ribosomal export protein NMD3 [Trichuris trichiura]